MSGNLRDPRAAIRANSPPDADQCAKRTLITMQLDGLRDARQLTQAQMAQLLKVSQGAVSKAERRTDMFISTLRNYVRAIGGDLQIRAVFPEGDVLIDQFTDTKPAESPAPRMSTEGRSEIAGANWSLNASGSAETVPEAE